MVSFASGIARLRVCGETRVYRRTTRSTWEDQTPEALAAEVPQWSDAGVQRFIQLLNDPAMVCTGGEPLVLRFILDHDGRAREVTGIEELRGEARECMDSLLSRARLTGRRRQRHVTASLSAAGPQSLEGAGRQTAGAQTDAFVESVRARLDENAAAILTCAGADSVAVDFQYEAGSPVQIDARDIDDPAIEACIRAAVGDLSAPADVPGTEGVHAVTR